MLKMEVMIPATMDFDFNDSRPMPFLSVPSTPERFGDYSLSAPTSPSRMADFYPSGVPFDWEEKPGTPKGGREERGEDGFDFAFDLSKDQMDTDSTLSAEELFDGGKIRPLKPPPRLQVEHADMRSPLLSPKSPRSPLQQGKKIIRQAFSPRRRKKSDPFATAAENTRKMTGYERGRERTPASLNSNPSRRATRSLSPYRVAEYPWGEEDRQQQQQQDTKQSELNSKNSLFSKGSSKKWRLRDFLLFRSASEGRASDKDYRKYPSLFRKPEDVKDSSFRSTESSSSSGSKRRGRVSAHELHYTANKAASEDLKKKTFLPYKQGILGRLAFTPTVFGSLAR